MIGKCDVESVFEAVLDNSISISVRGLLFVMNTRTILSEIVEGRCMERSLASPLHCYKTEAWRANDLFSSKCFKMPFAKVS